MDNSRLKSMTFGEARKEAPEITFWFWLYFEARKAEIREERRRQEEAAIRLLESRGYKVDLALQEPQQERLF